MTTLRHLILFVVSCAAAPSIAAAQYPRPGGDDAEFGSGRRSPNGGFPRSEPTISVVNLAAPPSAEQLPKEMALTDDQAKAYTAIRDSFVTATQSERDAARHRMEQLTGAVVGRDSAAADYYRERLRELNKSLTDQQSKFDEQVKKLLTKKQQKEYRDWRRKQEETARNPGRPESGRLGRE